MYIQNNLMGINIIRNSSKNIKRMEKSTEKLSSGLRINIAADDAAGLSISEKMRGQIRGLKMASKNALDAYSLMETREGALDEIHHMMQRMRELTVQSLNDTLTDGDRNKLQDEFKELQISISKIAEDTEFNTKPLFDPHEAAFYGIEGNNLFDDSLIKIHGFNNDLKVSIDGNEYELQIEEGFYTINEIADIVDSKLMEINSDLIINLTENNTMSLQAENSKEIDYIKGGLSFLFYEYKIGNPPGMIIGVTEFMENGKLDIRVGHNDKLNFYVGSSTKHTIDFSPKAGGYTIDELIDTINSQLEDKGEIDVKAIKYGDKHIALASDKFVITGLSGNMIKIDGITSVLYDNAKYGQVQKTQGYFSGRKNLSSGIEIQEGINDILRIKVDNKGDYKEIKLTAKKYNNINELIDEINKLASGKDLEIEAINSGKG